MKKHVIKQGETLGELAHRYGLSLDDLYNHEANSRLKKLRPDPNCVYPGDIVYIPDMESQSYSLATNRKHEIQVTIPTHKIILNFVDQTDTPIPDCKFNLSGGSLNIDGTVENGKIEEDIPINIKFLLLKLWNNPNDSDYFEEIDLEIGSLDPIEELSGIQGRLENLGYYSGKIDDDYGFITRESLKEFQSDQGIKVTGILDQATIDKIKEIYEG